MTRVLLLLFGLLVLTGCETYNPCTKIEYVSLRPTALKEMPIPDNANIALYFSIDDEFNVNVLVQNLTDDILTIDQTRSFFINSNKKSTAYYDPTIRTKTNTTTVGTTKGGSFNLGGVANAFGIGGIAGALMNATTVGRSNSEINSSTYTEVMADLPNVSIGPRGEMAMSKTFKVNVGDMNSFIAQNPDFSPVKFSITICYSFDNGETPCVINSDFFINSFMNEIVVERQTNAAIRSILTKKPNASLEPWYMLKSYRGYRNVENVQNQSIFYNYQ